jgi:hypothetical protein
MTALLKAGYDINTLRSTGEYSYVEGDKYYFLKVTSLHDAKERRCVIQERVNLHNGDLEVRVRAPDGGFTPWTPRVSPEQVTQMLVSAANGEPIKNACPERSGLMSRDCFNKLEGIEDGATADMTAEDIIKALGGEINAVKLNGKSGDAYAAHDHTHDDLATVDWARSVEVRVAELDALLQEVLAVLRDVSVHDIRGAEDFARVSDLTKLKLLSILGPIDAASLDGKKADSYAPADHKHDEYVKRGGVEARRDSANLGTVTNGEVILDPSKGRLQRYTNGGDHKLKAPSATGDHEFKVLITNSGAAGVIELSGFDGPQPYIPSTPGAQHLVTVTKIGPVVDIEVKALRGGA